MLRQLIKRWSVVFLVILPFTLYSGVKSNGYQLEIVAQDSGVIWSFDFISYSELIYTLKGGKLVYLNFQKSKKIPLPVPPSYQHGQGGLLDIKLYRIGKQSYLYATFSQEKEEDIITSLARSPFSSALNIKWKVIFQSKVKGRSGVHFGSRLAFDGTHLFMTIGDRGKRDEAQNIKNHHGAIIRLNPDGTAASKNPIVARGGLEEIWSYGHRNPQGIAFHPVTMELYSCEFGPRGGDELNLIRPGRNYGWPVITYGSEYYGPAIGTTHKKGMEQPLTYWVPSISPSGMAFYSGDKIPHWKNSLFLANLSSQHLRRLVLKGHQVVKQEELFADLGERIRYVSTGFDGYLYFSTDSGKIYKILAKRLDK